MHGWTYAGAAARDVLRMPTNVSESVKIIKKKIILSTIAN